MIYTTVTNLVWLNPEHTVFDCIVNFDTIGEVPFTANSADLTPHVQDIFSRAIAGDFGVIAEYVAPPVLPTPVPTQVSMKQARLALLAAGLLATVKTEIANRPEEDQINWEFSVTVKRSDSLTIALAAILALDETALDNLFISAAAFVS